MSDTISTSLIDFYDQWLAANQLWLLAGPLHIGQCKGLNEQTGKILRGKDSLNITLIRSDIMVTQNTPELKSLTTTVRIPLHCLTIR